MPTISGLELPKPKNWQDFETMARDALAQKWNSPNLQKNGRGGQNQDGVDIWGPDEIGRKVGVQCKRYKETPSLKLVKDEIEKAEKFDPLNTLWIVTTADHDAPLQAAVRTLSDKRVAAGKFAIGLQFWDDIIDALQLNPAVFRIHFPQVVLDAPTAISRERLIAALELGYHGANLWQYVIFTYGEIGQMAQSDPDELISTLRTLEHRASQLFAPDDAAPLLESIEAIRQGCLKKKRKKSDWDPVEVYSKRVSTRLGRSASLLQSAESNMLDLALQLGRLYFSLDERPEPSLRKSIETKVRTVLPPESDAAIRKKFAAAAKSRSGYGWVMAIYTLLDHELRWIRQPN